MNHLPVLVIVFPLLGGVSIALAGVKRPAARAVTAVTVAALHGVMLIMLIRYVYLVGPLHYYPGGWVYPVGIHLTVDAFSGFFLLILAVGHPATVLFRLGSDGLRGWDDKSATLTALYFTALTGIVVTGDLFNLFVFVELATVTTLGLISRKGRENSTVAGFIYLVLASVSGVMLLLGILLIYITTGTVTMVLVAQRIGSIPPHIHAVVAGCVLVSFGIKFGMVPGHLWQPRAYLGSGSTVAAVFSAIGMKIYLYALIRLLWLPLQVPELLPRLFDLLLVAGMVNILAGHLAALAENNLVRMLSFSSVAHAGYILLGIAVAGRVTPAAGIVAIVATLFHMAMHALAKSTLLWSGRTFIARRRSSSFSALSGAGRGAVGNVVAFSLGALAVVGIPPTGGFASKWYVALAQSSLVPVLVIAAGTVISLVYYGRFFIVLADRNGPGDAAVSSEGPARPSRSRRMLSPDTALILTLGIAALAAGPMEGVVREYLRYVAAALFGGGNPL